MTLYDRVKNTADDKGMSIREVEIKANVGNGTIKRWQSATPRVDTLKAVADVLEVPVEFFFDLF